MKEKQPANAQLYCSDYDGCYMFRLRKVAIIITAIKLYFDGLYFFHYVLYRQYRAVTVQ